MANNGSITTPLVQQQITTTQTAPRVEGGIVVCNTSLTPDAVNYCGEFLYDFHEDIGLSVVFGFSFVIGLVMIFAGYRLFRISLFTQSFSLIAVIIYQLLSSYAGLTTQTYYCGLAGAGGGIAVGLIATFVRTIGLFGLSLVQGVFVGTCILYVINIFTELANAFIPPTIVLICFVFLAIPTIKYEKVLVILYTSSYGTVLIMLSVDYFLNLSMLRNLAYELLVSLRQVERTKPCWFSWILFGLWPIMVILGFLVQLLKTGKYYDHKEDDWCCKKKKEPSVHLLSSKNDVIAKAWIYGPSTPSLKGDCDEDEALLMEDTTPV